MLLRIIADAHETHPSISGRHSSGVFFFSSSLLLFSLLHAHPIAFWPSTRREVSKGNYSSCPRAAAVEYFPFRSRASTAFQWRHLRVLILTLMANDNARSRRHLQRCCEESSEGSLSFTPRWGGDPQFSSWSR